MGDLEDTIQVVSDFDAGLLEWREAYLKLRDMGTADHVIKEAIGDEPEPL